MKKITFIVIEIMWQKTKKNKKTFKVLKIGILSFDFGLKWDIEMFLTGLIT